VAFPLTRMTTSSRVLFLNDTARNGGPGRSLAALLRFLDPRWIHRTVILPRPGEIADLLQNTGAADEVGFAPGWVENIVEPWRRPMSREDFEAPAPLPGWRAAGNVARMSWAFWGLRRTLVRNSHALIYCNGTTANFVGAALGLITGVPVLWHVRYTGLPASLHGLHRRLSTSGAVRRIVCVSRPAAALFDACPEKVTVIPNGVDTQVFAPTSLASQSSGAGLRAELGLPADTVIFGSHGRILRKKGYIEMLLAAKLALTLLRKSERARCHFVVVGDTPQDFQPDHVEECRRLATTLGIAEHVTFTGFRADVRPLVAEFDVAVVPSIYPDPLPRAVIESMALGKPVIAFDVGGVSEMLTPREGLLLPGRPPDVEAMAIAMLRLLQDPEARRRLGAAARERAVQQFDARAHACRIQTEILRIVAPRMSGQAQAAAA
jgi:glycosyltransferase involved in cell wall biosynthesis